MASKHPRIAWLPLLAAAAACVDHPAAPVVPDPPSLQREELRCVANVRARTMDCEPPRASGPRANIILGGQGVHVRLTTANASYDTGDELFSADVSLQNLLDQPLGTDGASTYGSKVFFHSGPTVTSGTGTVEVDNPDGTGTFTDADQPYFDYPGIILPRGTSAPKTWGFDLPPTVLQFAFTVYVETQLPAEAGVLHWQLEDGTPVSAGMIYGIYAAAPHQVFAVDDDAVLHYDGNSWWAFATCQGCYGGYAVGGTAGDDVWAVGEGSAVLHFDGESWTRATDPDLVGGDYTGVWAAARNDVWIVSNVGRILHWDGADWTDFTDAELTTAVLLGVWGAAPDDVWVVGDFGTILHWDGTGWSLVQSTPDGMPLLSVSGTGADDVWAVGGNRDVLDDMWPVSGGIALHWDGTGWTADDDPDVAEYPLTGVWAGPGGTAWAVSPAGVLELAAGEWIRVSSTPLWSVFGTSAVDVFAGGLNSDLHRYDGGSWTQMTAARSKLYGVWAATGSDVWAAGEAGTLLHRTGGSWTTESSPTSEELYAVWGSSADDVWAVGAGGTALHRTGGTWDEDSTGTLDDLKSVHGSSASDVLAVGMDGTALHYDGAAWSETASGTTDDLYGVWAASSTAAFAVGDHGVVLRWDGSGWSPMVTGTLGDLWGVWGAAADDVYAVGETGIVLHYDGNPGGTWTAVATPAGPDDPVVAVWGSASDDVYALADYGFTVLHWDGSTWTTMSSFSEKGGIGFYGLAGAGPQDLYAVGDLGAILHGTR